MRFYSDLESQRERLMARFCDAQKRIDDMMSGAAPISDWAFTVKLRDETKELLDRIDDVLRRARRRHL